MSEFAVACCSSAISRGNKGDAESPATGGSCGGTESETAEVVLVLGSAVRFWLYRVWVYRPDRAGRSEAATAE